MCTLACSAGFWSKVRYLQSKVQYVCRYLRSDEVPQKPMGRLALGYQAEKVRLRAPAHACGTFHDFRCTEADFRLAARGIDSSRATLSTLTYTGLSTSGSLHPIRFDSELHRHRPKTLAVMSNL